MTWALLCREPLTRGADGFVKTCLETWTLETGNGYVLRNYEVRQGGTICNMSMVFVPTPRMPFAHPATPATPPATTLRANTALDRLSSEVQNYIDLRLDITLVLHEAENTIATLKGGTERERDIANALESLVSNLWSAMAPTRTK